MGAKNMLRTCIGEITVFSINGFGKLGNLHVEE
jgi:hypothetical protein